jgi:murein DD-endopeptidase MepM/ murein hydrolase activator NlpD
VSSVAIATLTVACATVPTHQESLLLAPPAVAAAEPAPVTPDWGAMRLFARVADAFAVPVSSAVLDGIVRWQHATRDRLHGLEARLTAVIDQARLVVPDLTVLAIEPVAHTESSGFGWRDDPIRHRPSFHSGTDFRGKPGTPVVAAGDGIVIFSGRRGGYGNVIDIDHGGGVITRYAHLRKIETARDVAVTAGDPIGQLGSTGRTTGPHLHFEVRLDGAPVSPIAAMWIGALQRQSPLAGRLAALSLSPDIQAIAESDIDPPRQRARTTKRPERVARAKRQQVLW